MVHRVESYIRNGWGHMIIDPDDCSSRDPKCDHVEPAIHPEAPSWENLIFAFSGPEVVRVPLFSDGQMIEYFVTRTVSDGLPAGDFKSMNTILCQFSN